MERIRRWVIQPDYTMSRPRRSEVNRLRKKIYRKKTKKKNYILRCTISRGKQITGVTDVNTTPVQIIQENEPGDRLIQLLTFSQTYQNL